MRAEFMAITPHQIESTYTSLPYNRHSCLGFINLLSTIIAVLRHNSMMLKQRRWIGTKQCLLAQRPKAKVQ